MDSEIQKFMEQRGMNNVLNKTTPPLQDDQKIKRVEIIVLKYKSPEMEKDCVSRIIEYTQWPYKLNVFDNRGNGPNTSKAWNKLIRESTCDYVLLIDSDAFVQGGIDSNAKGGHEWKQVCWVTEMMKAFNMYKDVAIVGPVCGTPATSTMQSMAPKDRDPFLIDGHLSGYCFLLKKSVLEEIGWFDEDFCFYGQESDWIERVLEMGKHKIVIVPRAHVIHGYNQEGSQAARQASNEGELNIDTDASFSYLMWNMKKKKRMEAMGKEYTFKFD